jgi:hypothetical protein
METVHSAPLVDLRIDLTGTGSRSSALGPHAMDSEAGVDGEAPVQLLLHRTEVPCCFGHGDDLG